MTTLPLVLVPGFEHTTLSAECPSRVHGRLTTSAYPAAVNCPTIQSAAGPMSDEKVCRVWHAASASSAASRRVGETSSTRVATYLSGSVPVHLRAVTLRGTAGAGGTRLSGTGKVSGVVMGRPSARVAPWETKRAPVVPAYECILERHVRHLVA